MGAFFAKTLEEDLDFIKMRHHCRDVFEKDLENRVPLWNEFVNFIKLHRFVDQDETLSASKVIDDIWHEALLWTNGYENMCLAHCGRFIHHYPERSEKTRDHFLRYSKAYRLYTEKFGEPPLRFWPKPDETYQHEGEC